MHLTREVSRDPEAARSGAQGAETANRMTEDLHLSEQRQMRMNPQQRSEYNSRIRLRGADVSLPSLTLEDAKKSSSLPSHLMETDDGLGTRTNPVNNNCQTTTLKNLFNYFGLDAQADKVNGWQSDLLHDIHDRHGANVDHKAAKEAFKNDVVPPSVIHEAIKTGHLDDVFQSNVDIKALHQVGSATTPELATLFLSEMGCKPEQLRLGSTSAARAVRDALDSGKPVIFGDSDTHTLLQRALAVPGERAKPPVQGHVYMAYKKGDDYYVADPGYREPVKVTPEQLREKLLDSHSRVNIINAVPDPSKFLHH